MSTTESELETVYVQDDNVKNMELKAVPVLRLDAGSFDLSQTDPVFESPVPVFEESQDGELIGAAHLYVRGRQVFADIFIDYSSPMRLTIEAGHRVCPMVSSTVTAVAAGIVTEIRIESVVLMTASADIDIDVSKYWSN